MMVPHIPYTREQTCCFTGHREIKSAILADAVAQINHTVQELYRRGVVAYMVGGARGFDSAVAAELIRLRDECCPHLKVILVRPCPDQTKGWRRADLELYEYVQQRVDYDILLSEYYFAGCMLRRNDYMVDNSAYLLAYVMRSQGGSYYTLQRATKQNLAIKNFANPWKVLTGRATSTLSLPDGADL